MIRWTMIIALTTWGATVVAALALSRFAASTSGVRATPSVTEVLASPSGQPADRLVGFAMNVHDVWDTAQYTEAIDEVVAFGANSLLITTPMFQDDGAASTIGRDPDRCPTIDELNTIVSHARRHGLRVAIMPVLLLRHPRSNEWRGRITPRDWDGWWASYSQQMIAFADLASRHDVDTLFVGSELNSTENMSTRWRALIADVRARFSGRLTYSANWDRYQKVQFWDALDMIAVSAWFELSDQPLDETQDEQLVARWREIRDDLLRHARAQSRPLLLSEIGYPTVPWSLADPWNYVPKNGTTPDPTGQARGYRAFFDAWSGIRDTPDDGNLAGLFCYEWDVHRAGGPDDFGYGIVGKPAYSIVADGFRIMMRL